uniref:TATA box-binding protein-like 1 n=1 Tax=Caenorhabditis tropicalis TaxID=1561998 RepID=A0A1I7UY61_9PELO
MQMGDHQMMGNQRPFVQKVIPVQPGGGVAQNPAYVQTQGVRMVHIDGNGQQRTVQMAPVVRQMPQNATGAHYIRQTSGGQQFQSNYGQGVRVNSIKGTIAGRSVGSIRTIPQHGYQRPGNANQMGSQQPPRAGYAPSNPNQQPQQMSFNQTIQRQQNQQIPLQQQQNRQHFNQIPSNQNQMIMQHRQQGSAPQQHHQMPHQQMSRQPVAQHPHQQNVQRHPQHHLQQSQQVHHQPQGQHHHLQQLNAPRGMNLSVPLREPSPEPVQVKIEEPEVPPETTSKVQEEPLPEDGDIDIQIRNVVCNYTLPLHIDLRKLAMNTHNVTYEREKGVMMKQKRSPGCYIKVYSSGKVYIVGCRSEVDCKRAARSIARHVQRVMGKTKERVSIRNYRVNNVLATCRLPFGIKIEEVAAKYPSESTYEPELSVGLVWRSITPKATLRIHTTGSITVTGASSEADVLEVLSKIYPIVVEFRCQERAKGNIAAQKKRKRKAPINKGPPIKRERFDDANYGNSGVINNQVYFSDEDEDLYDDLDLDD